MKNIIIFASGSGTNAQNIIEYFQVNQLAKVSLVISNKKEAKVFERAQKLEVPSIYFTKDEFYKNNTVLSILKEHEPDLIVLAGFLLKFPENILSHFPNKVINIHPALLPKYGGKGMYGSYVHQAVIDNKESETGITIHFVNENYDEGAIVFQKSIPLNGTESVHEVAQKVHRLEYEYFPRVIENLLSNKLQ